MKKKRILIAGWFGYGNLGDDAILYSEITQITKYLPHLELFVLRYSPVDTMRIFGVHPIYVKNKRTLIKLVSTIDMCVIGGGGIIKPFSARKYAVLMLICKFIGSRVMLYSVGVSELKSRLERLLVLLACQLSDVISVRDLKSYTNLINIGVKKQIHLTADPVFAFPSVTPTPSDKKPYVVLSLKQWMHEDLSNVRDNLSYDLFLEMISRVCDWIVKKKQMNVGMCLAVG